VKPKILLALAALCLTGCGEKLPAHVSSEVLDTAINDGVGDPNTCVLIGKAGSGAVVHRYGTHVVCALAWPVCGRSGNRTPDDLLKQVSRNPAPVAQSCKSNNSGSRTVAWAAGSVSGRPGLIYAAVMEGENTPPGVVIADRLQAAFRKAGL